jgi:hypothetical protein
MATTTELLRRYRMPFLAVLVSTAVHAALLVGMPRRIEAIDPKAAPLYSATLDPAVLEAAPAPPPAVKAPAPPAPAARKPRPRKPPPPAPPPAPSPGPSASIEEAPVEPPPADVVAEATAISSPPAPEPPQDPPEVVALAAPDVLPVPEPPVPAPETFPVEGLPASLQIDYALKSSLADARAVYRWSREGDAYRITGEGEAEGFFALFLEGRMLQESRGTVTASGLRPERFTEKKPNVEDEGLQFDWPGHTVTFERGTTRNTTPLTDNTVDWLSMIFQLAHVPPPQGAETMQLRVFTQRRLYKFDLKVLGIEEINIPLGKVRALHLRHVDPEDKQVVDVWLGVDQHYLPVKMRYPVARNRLIVEQSATRVSSQ